MLAIITSSFSSNLIGKTLAIIAKKAILNNNIAISKKAILSGLQFNDKAYVHKHFYKNDIKKYMDNYLSTEVIECDKVKKLIKE